MRVLTILSPAPAPAPCVPEGVLPQKAIPVNLPPNLEANVEAPAGPEEPPSRLVNLVAKWNKRQIDLVLDSNLTLGELKRVLESETAVPPGRQRLVGLKAAKGKADDNTQLGALVLKLPAHRFILMGTPDDQLLAEPTEQPRILDDWSLSGDHETKYTAWEWRLASRGELDGFNEGTQRPWRCVFVDTFSKDGVLDPKLWSHQIDCNRWVHNSQHGERLRGCERQWYTEGQNASVKDGILRIEARKEPTEGQAYSSARLTTRDSKLGRWRYGRIEVCAKLPAGRPGLWPAIWMMPSASKYGDWPKSGEVDLMENVGWEPGVVRASVHTAQNHRRRGNHNRRVSGVRDAHEHFHVYACEWTRETLDFYVDDRKFYSYRNTHKGTEHWPFDEYFHLILNVAVGGTWGGRHGIDDAAFPTAFEIAFVKVFQRREDIAPE